MWITPKRGVMFVVFISHKNIFFDFLILPSHLLCAVSSLLSVCCVMRFTRRESLILSEAWIYFDMQYPATALPSHLEPCFYQCSAICWWFVALQFKLHSVCVRILRVMFSVCAHATCVSLWEDVSLQAFTSSLSVGLSTSYSPFHLTLKEQIDFFRHSTFSLFLQRVRWEDRYHCHVRVWKPGGN